MTEPVITEYAGARGGRITGFYQYSRDGVRVYDSNRGLKRLYLFDPSSDMMTERDPLRTDKILRRFMFDRNGMLEETFSFGQSPRTFRYEDGGRRIVVREGGDYGAVGKTFTFESTGISETGWGRHGEIERVYVFEPGNDAITERNGGWYGDIARTIIFEGISASLFREPEAFLQFLMFTERQHNERDEEPQAVRADANRGTKPAAGRSRYAFTGKRHTTSGEETGKSRDARIDDINEGDPASQKQDGTPMRKSSDIPFEERRKGRKP
jgi:hypothetical protein